jgi:hypothetical protein
MPIDSEESVTDRIKLVPNAKRGAFASLGFNIPQQSLEVSRPFLQYLRGGTNNLILIICVRSIVDDQSTPSKSLNRSQHVIEVHCKKFLVRKNREFSAGQACAHDLASDERQ